MKVDEAIARPLRHSMEDGVVEMTLGVQLFLMGVLCLSWKLPVGIPWLTVLPFLITGRVIQLLKERVVAPRAGYVVPREEELEIRVSSQGIKIDKASQRMLIITGALVVWTLGLLVLIPNRMFPHLPGRWQGMVGVWIAVSLAACSQRRFSSRQFSAPWAVRVSNSWALPAS